MIWSSCPQDDSIDMEHYLKMTVSIWEMTVTIWEMTVSIWDIVSLCMQATHRAAPSSWTPPRRTPRSHPSRQAKKLISAAGWLFE